MARKTVIFILLSTLAFLCAKCCDAEAVTGQVIAWGMNHIGQTNVPVGLSDVIAIAAGEMKSLALKKDGTVVAWGDWTNQPPGLTNVTAIACGDRQNLALLSSGAIIQWNWDYKGNPQMQQAPVGLIKVVKLAAGKFHDLVLLSDGTVKAWGGFGTVHGEVITDGTQVPVGLNVRFVRDTGSSEPWPA
jgi:alpha-tubulin suppressor-like RCC1 family protein